MGILQEWSRSSQNQAEDGMVIKMEAEANKKKESWRCYTAGFEYGGKGYMQKHVNGLWAGSV